MADVSDERVQPALHAMLTADTDALQAATDADPEIVAISWGENTLLEWVTQPPHGVAPAIVDVLIANGAALDRALNLAGCWNLSELSHQLLAAGADPAAQADAGITPLESAAMHGSTDAADVLAAHGLHRPSLWLAAAAGLLSEVQSWLSAGGELLRPAGPRPNWADVGRPAGAAPTDDPAEIIGEAFVFAAANGRIGVADHLLVAGADINARPYRNTTGLHLAIQFHKADAVAYLLTNGAATNINDDQYDSDAHGWAQACLDDGPASQQIAELLGGPPL